MNALAIQGNATANATAAIVDPLVRRMAGSLLSDGAAATNEAIGGSAATDDDVKMRGLVGEFVGNVFYGTLLRQMGQSNFKGKYMHGGRGEEVFQSQLHMEYAKRLGRAPGDPIAERIYESMTRQKRGAELNAANSARRISDDLATAAKRGPKIERSQTTE